MSRDDEERFLEISISDESLTKAINLAECREPDKSQTTYLALKQLRLIRKRRCSHEWQYANTMSAEGIFLKGFHVCFKCNRSREI